MFCVVSHKREDVTVSCTIYHYIILLSRDPALGLILYLIIQLEFISMIVATESVCFSGYCYSIFQEKWMSECNKG